MIRFLLILWLVLVATHHSYASESSIGVNERLENTIAVLQGDAREEALEQLRLQQDDLIAAVRELNNAQTYMLLGKVYFYAEMDSNAIKAFTSAQTLDRSLSEPHFFIGIIHRYAEDLDAAEKSFRDAISVNNEDEKSFIELGRTLEMKGDIKSAKSAYKNALQVNGENFDANFNLATIFAIEDNFESAEKYYLMAIEQEPNDLESLYNLGQLYQNVRQRELAIKHFGKVVKLYPNEWQAMAKLVQEYEALGDYPARDLARDGIYDIWRSNAMEDLNDQGFYIREQSVLESGKLFVLEYFELKGERAKKYVFKLQDKKTKDIKFDVSLGSYDATTKISRSLGEITNNERMYHLDGYAPNGTHYTYAFFDSMPTYETVKEIAFEVLSEKFQPLSSSAVSGE